MVFDCHNAFFLDTKCEWRFLTAFVEQYNKENGTNYQRERCLDVDVKLRHTAQPEVLLVDSSGHRMVIERKSIVWPKNHIQRHKDWHRKADRFAKEYGGYYEEEFPVEQEPDEIQKAREAALHGFSDAYTKMLPVVSKKLKNWPDTLHVYVVQFIGNGNWIFEEDIEKIIKETMTPTEIDQVWFAYPEWVDEDNYEVAWKLAR